jgi:hypothetical protein
MFSVVWGTERSSLTGEHDREVGIRLKIEIEGTSSCPKVIGKAVSNISFAR